MFIKCSEAHGCSTLRDRRHTSLGRAVKPRRVVVGGQVTQRRLDEECDAPGTPFAVLNLAEKNQQVGRCAGHGGVAWLHPPGGLDCYGFF